jgi:hypothetical protein
MRGYCALVGPNVLKFTGTIPPPLLDVTPLPKSRDTVDCVVSSGAEGKHIHLQPGIAGDKGQNVFSTGRAGQQANHS